MSNILNNIINLFSILIILGVGVYLFLQMKKMTKNVDTIIHTACTAYEGLSVFSPYLVGQNTYQISMSTCVDKSNDIQPDSDRGSRGSVLKAAFR